MKQPSSFPRHRAHAAVRASRGNLTASWNIHAVSGYSNATRTGRWAGWTGHDLAVQWRRVFGLDGMRLAGGVLNVGDRQPASNPADPESPALTYDSVRGRTFFLNVSAA